MKPTTFKEATKTLQKPEQMTDDKCGPLKVYNDGKQCISCWKPSFKERLSILFFGKIWLSVLSGDTQPPVWLDGSKTVFVRPTLKERFLKVWTRDKKLHTLAGFIISIILGAWWPFVGIIAAVIAGGVKEWWDSKGNGTVEFLDFVFTVIGGLIAWPVTFFVVSPLLHLIF